MKVTDKNAIKIAKRVEFWKKELAHLGLAHWRIEAVSIVEEVPGNPHAAAGVKPSSFYASAHFWFQADHVENSTLRELDETYVHEWLHVLMRDFDEAINSVEDFLAPGVAAVWDERVHASREHMVEALARTLVAQHYANKA